MDKTTGIDMAGSAELIERLRRVTGPTQAWEVQTAMSLRWDTSRNTGGWVRIGLPEEEGLLDPDGVPITTERTFAPLFAKAWTMLAEERRMSHAGAPCRAKSPWWDIAAGGTLLAPRSLSGGGRVSSDLDDVSCTCVEPLQDLMFGAVDDTKVTQGVFTKLNRAGAKGKIISTFGFTKIALEHCCVDRGRARMALRGGFARPGNVAVEHGVTDPLDAAILAALARQCGVASRASRSGLRSKVIEEAFRGRSDLEGLEPGIQHRLLSQRIAVIREQVGRSWFDRRIRGPLEDRVLRTTMDSLERVKYDDEGNPKTVQEAFGNSLTPLWGDDLDGPGSVSSLTADLENAYFDLREESAGKAKPLVLMKEASQRVVRRRGLDQERLTSAWSDPERREVFAGLARHFERRWSAAERGAARHRALGVSPRTEIS